MGTKKDYTSAPPPQKTQKKKKNPHQKRPPERRGKEGSMVSLPEGREDIVKGEKEKGGGGKVDHADRRRGLDGKGGEKEKKRPLVSLLESPQERKKENEGKKDRRKKRKRNHNTKRR